MNELNLDWKLIREKYNKSFYTFNKYFNEKIEGKLKYFELCYCDLEKFFDDNGIIIQVEYYEYANWFAFTIYQNKNLFFSEACESIFHKTRLEAKIAAIYKAFGILEEKLNGIE